MCLPGPRPLPLLTSFRPLPPLLLPNHPRILLSLPFTPRPFTPSPSDSVTSSAAAGKQQHCARCRLLPTGQLAILLGLLGSLPGAGPVPRGIPPPLDAASPGALTATARCALIPPSFLPHCLHCATPRAPVTLLTLTPSFTARAHVPSPMLLLLHRRRDCSLLP